jgi:hypothetical protein
MREELQRLVTQLQAELNGSAVDYEVVKQLFQDGVVVIETLAHCCDDDCRSFGCKARFDRGFIDWKLVSLLMVAGWSLVVAVLLWWAF